MGKVLFYAFVFSQSCGDNNITFDILILIAVLLAMVLLFVLETLPMEVTAMGAIGILLLFDILSWQESISGFSNFPMMYWQHQGM